MGFHKNRLRQITFIHMHPFIAQLLQSVSAERQAVLNHPVYDHLHRPADLSILMEHHAFTIWDAAYLLQSIGRQSQTRYAQSVLSPEAQYTLQQLTTYANGFEGNGRFAQYLQVMQRTGADTSAVEQLQLYYQNGVALPQLLQMLKMPAPVSDFILYTFYAIHQLPLHAQIAMLTLGRDDLMHQGLRPRLMAAHWLPHHLKQPLDDALCGHWAVVNMSPAQAAVHLLTELCGEEQVRWTEATQAVRQTLIRRKQMLDHIMLRINQHQLASLQGH